MNLTDADAVLFDLDGVITPTADVHMAAWSRMFNGLLRERGIAEPYTDADYFAYVDGKPRYDGVRGFLTSRGIALPEGTPGDPSAAETVCGLGNRKNDVFTEVLRRDGVRAYPGSLALVDALEARGTPMAIVSSSRNARPVLDAAGLTHRFACVIDGLVAAEEGLPGKPAPDTFLRAAERLGVPAGRAAVFEDAVAGVRAGAAGGFGLVVGVDRGAGEEALRDAGAGVVVDDLARLVPGAGRTT
ncbi:MAG: beta-phosphoglucomutase family hydrolase [Thermoleophilia bacterium]|nr:beta-phosphoglucomutase family hydrolase [Thermoleophilia bacterium]